MSDDQPFKATAAAPDKVGYGNPPKHTQFKKGQSGNQKGSRKEAKVHMPVGRIIKHCLSEPVKGLCNGKRRKMTKLQAIIEVQSALALKGDTRAAKLLIDLGHKHIAPHQTLEELRGDRPLFTFTEEERAKFSIEKLKEGIVFDDAPPKGEKDNASEEDEKLR